MFALECTVNTVLSEEAPPPHPDPPHAPQEVCLCPASFPGCVEETKEEHIPPGIPLKELLHNSCTAMICVSVLNLNSSWFLLRGIICLSSPRYEDGSEFLPVEADVCDEDTEAYVTNLSYYHLVPFETDILE